MPQLVIVSGTDVGAVYEINRDRTSMGRSISNTIQIVDRRMSRNHAEVINSGGRFFLRDLGSKNGTFLNGQLVKGEVEIRDQDMIQVGDTEIRFEGEEMPGAPTGRSVNDTTREFERRPSSTASLRLVEENVWGNTRSQRRAGYDPSQTSALALDTARLPDIRNANQRLEILYQVTDTIRSVFNLEELLDRISSIIQKVITPDRTYLILLDEENNLYPAVGKVRADETEKEIKISSSIVERCLKEGVSLLVTDATSDSRFNASESIIVNEIRTAMVSPLIYKGESLGVIYVDTLAQRAPFSDAELDLLTSIANQAAVAITNVRLQGQLLEQHKMAREMEIARTIQMNLLPKTYPDLPGYQLSAMSLPAKQVGGDYYDFIQFPDGRVGLAIADVSGKGVPAAILTATTRSYLQSETQHKDSTLSQTVSRINRMVHRDVTNDMYVTMFLCAVDPVEGSLEYINAGHSHPILLAPNGKMTNLEEGGTFLGILPDLRFDCGKATIPPGGILVLYTDGVTDILSNDGSHFGTDRFFELLADKQHLSAEEIRNAIYQACTKHRGSAEQFDDFTLIILKRLDFNESELD